MKPPRDQNDPLSNLVICIYEALPDEDRDCFNDRLKSANCRQKKRLKVAHEFLHWLKDDEAMRPRRYDERSVQNHSVDMFVALRTEGSQARIIIRGALWAAAWGCAERDLSEPITVDNEEAIIRARTAFLKMAIKLIELIEEAAS